MRRPLLLLLTLLSAASLIAQPKFEAGKRYFIVCQQFPQGCVTDGATANRNTPLYYSTTTNQNEENLWIFEEVYWGNFTIKNAKTGQYVTYDGVRQDSPQLRRYVSMTNEIDGNKSLWSIREQPQENVYQIRNVEQDDHIWDVRVDSYCVGTYSNTGDSNQNQCFLFYDENGQVIGERADNYTPEGFDVSSWLEATSESLDFWQVDGGWFLNTGAGGAHIGDMAYLYAPFIENWHESAQGPLEDCSLTQTLQNLPSGTYTLQADMMAVRQAYGWGQGDRPATGVQLFANDYKTKVATGNDPPERFSVDFVLDDSGIVTLGVSAKNTNANWIAIDNIQVLYHGTDEEMLEGEKEKIRKELADYFTPNEIEARISACGNSFYELEQLRKSIATMASTDPLAKAMKNLHVEERALVYVESLDLYLCTLPLENFGSTYQARIDYEPREGYGTLTIDGTKVEPGSNYRFQNVRGGRNYRFSITDPDGKKIEKSITFTSLPVVKIYGSFNNDYQQGSIIVHETDKAAPELLRMKAKWRGGITNSNGKHKRNYHVKLLDENGEKLETKFFGLRNDNSWILESCQVDMSRIRNRVLTDLWNDYSTPPYYIDQEPKAKSGTRGQFVELILNDEYRGIYCMTENMDRKQLKLKKHDDEANVTHGQLWKSKDWSYGVFMGHDYNSNNYPMRHPSSYYPRSEMWENYQVKYPAFEDYDYTTDWETLYNAVDFVCTSTNNVFKQHFSEYFDMPVVIDYYILMETILSTDNHGKNMYFAVYDKQVDKKITFAVWDMDATCGQRWSDEYYHSYLLRPDQDYAQFITNNEHGDYNLFRRLRNTDTEDFNMKVRLRYRDLRQNWLSTESILNRFRTQLDEFKTCGAAQREYDRWSKDSDVANRELDFTVEMDYLDDWFTRRMEYLDKTRFKISELPNGIKGVQTLPTTADTDAIYNLRGQKIGTADHAEHLPAGIYIVNGRKVVVK